MCSSSFLFSSTQFLCPLSCTLVSPIPILGTGVIMLGPCLRARGGDRGRAALPASSPASVVRDKTSFQPPWRVSPAQRKTTTGSRSPIPFPCSNAAPRRAALYVVPAIAPECKSFVSSIHSTRLGGRLKCRALQEGKVRVFPQLLKPTLSKQSQTDPLQLFFA